MENITIRTLHCGTMRVKPSEAYCKAHNGLNRRVELPVNAYLIEHPVHGRILLDTGWSADCRNLLTAWQLSFYDPHIEPGQTAVEQLAALGILPEDIDVVLLSHLDVDHTCALKDFAGKAKRIVCSELEYFYSCRPVYKKREVWDTWMPYAEQIERIYFHGSVLGPVKRGFDLFGDDSVLCIYCPGHTDGIFTTIVNHGPSNRFNSVGMGIYGGQFAVLTSDVAFSQRNIDDQVIPGYGYDKQQQGNALKFLRDLQQDPKCVATLFSHSPDCSHDVITF